MQCLLFLGLAGAVLVDASFTTVLGNFNDFKENVMQSITESPSFSNLMQSIPQMPKTPSLSGLTDSFSGLTDSVSDHLQVKMSGLQDSVQNVMADLDVQRMGLGSYYSSLISQTATSTRVDAKNDSAVMGSDAVSKLESEVLATTTEDAGASTAAAMPRDEGSTVAETVAVTSTEDVVVEDVIPQNEGKDVVVEAVIPQNEANGSECAVQRQHISALEKEVERLTQSAHIRSMHARQDANVSLVYPGVQFLALFVEALHELVHKAYSAAPYYLKPTIDDVRPLVQSGKEIITSLSQTVVNRTSETAKTIVNKSWAAGEAIVNEAVARSWTHCESLLKTAMNATQVAGIKWNLTSTISPAVRDSFNEHLSSVKQACGDVNRDLVKPYLEVAKTVLAEGQKAATEWAIDAAPITTAKELGDFIWDVAKQELNELKTTMGPTNLTLHDGTVVHFPYGFLDMAILGLQVVIMLWLFVYRIGFQILFWQILVQTLLVQVVIHSLLLGSLASVWALFMGTLYFVWMVFLGVADAMKFSCCCCARRHKGSAKGSWLSTFSPLVTVTVLCLCTLARLVVTHS